MMRSTVFLVLLLGLNAHADLSKKIVITVDDLPGREIQKSSPSDFLAQIVDTLKAEKIPATGFVIGRLASQSERQLNALLYWARHGLPLANHNWDHVEYSSQTVEQFLEGVRKTEDLLKPLRIKYGPWPLAFRFPMLNQGDTPEKEKAVNKYFADTKTLFSHVSVDTSDWAFAQYYENFLKNTPEKTVKLEKLYLAHVLDCVEYAESALQAVFGKQIPQIILLHANQLNCKMMGEIIKILRQRGYEFTGLEKALNDSAYLAYKYKIAYQPADHFFFQMAQVLSKSLPQGPDCSSYKYFQTLWEKKIKSL